MEQGSQPHIETFKDYREFLSSWVAYKKKQTPGFSLRQLNKKLGFSSPSYFQAILKGKRSLSPRGVLRFGNYTKMTISELSLLQLLVKMNDAKSSKKKEQAYKELLEHRGLHNIVDLPSQAELFLSHWLYPAIFCLLQTRMTFDSAVKLQKFIYPSVSLDEVEKALAVMERLGLLKVSTRTGRYLVKSSNLRIADGFKQELFDRLHRQFLEVSLRMITELPAGNREFNGTTVSVNSRKLPEMKKFLQTVRSRFRVLFDDPEGDSVMHMETLLLPLTRNLADGAQQGGQA